MSNRTKWLTLGLCLAASVTFGAENVKELGPESSGAFDSENVAAFVKQSLDLDLKSISFGMAVPTNSGYVKVDSPPSVAFLEVPPDLQWMISPASSQYQTKFPNRTVIYGFRDSHLAVVHISLSAFVGNQGQFDARRKELLQIEEEYESARLPQKSIKAGLANDSFRIVRGANCAPTPDSLFLMEFEITPVEQKDLFDFPILPDAFH